MDELEYYTYAGQVADGSYEFYPRRTVGHLLVLAALRKAFDDRLVPIQLAVSAIFSLTAPLAYLLARRELRDHRAALLGGLGVMLWPLFVRYGATLYSETVALPLFAGFLLAVPGPRAAGDGRGGRWFGAGMVLGLCMHYRPMYLLYSPFGALVAYWRGRAGRAGVAHHATRFAGFGAELAAMSSEERFGQLEGPVARVGARFAPIGSAPSLEGAVLPSAATIADAVRHVVGS